MRIAGLQLDLAWEDPARNHHKAREWVACAARAGAQLVVLPEMFASGFSMDTAKVAEPHDGPSTALLLELARTHEVHVCGSIAQRAVGDDGAQRPFNTLVLASPQGELHRYRKIHPFTFAKEHEYYAAGESYLTVSIHGVRVTFFVCYDLRFADEFWLTAEQTDLYVIPANWPERRRLHWSTLLRARAIENQAYVLGVNRVGEGSGLTYAGDSAIYGPWGETLMESSMAEGLLLADIDPAKVAHARTTLPVLPDRRPLSRAGASSRDGAA